jgi:hypothetical protein
MATHLIAALLCSAITSRREARAVRELHRAASRVLAADRSTASQRAAAQESAERLWDLVAAQPEGERVPVLVALARSLLDDAPEHCVDLDRALRDAAARHGWPVSAEHEQTARALRVGLDTPS